MDALLAVVAAALAVLELVRYYIGDATGRDDAVLAWGILALAVSTLL